MTVQEDIVAALEPKTVTKVIGQPTNKAIDVLQDELAKIATTIKTTLFQDGNKYGHLAIIVAEDEYRLIINNRVWFYAEPQHPGYYDASIDANTTEHEAKKKEAEHKEKLRLYQVFLGVEQALREKIVGAVDQQYLAALEEDYVGYTGTTPLLMLEHLRKHCCKITNKDKTDLADEFQAQWDQTQHITTYFRMLEKVQKKMKRMKLQKDDSELVMQAVKEMYAADIFDEKEMIAWENKTDAQKTWPNAKNVF